MFDARGFCYALLERKTDIQQRNEKRGNQELDEVDETPIDKFKKHIGVLIDGPIWRGKIVRS